MAKKNIMVEASERYRDFQKRGLIPKGTKNAYLDFVREVGAERTGKEFTGRYTAKGMSKSLGIKVTYFNDEVEEDILYKYYENILEREKGKLLDIFDVNDFIEMAEKYGEENEINLNAIMTATTFSEVLRLAESVVNLDTYSYLYRNKSGRNRRTESEEMLNYQNDMTDDLSVFKSELKEFMDSSKHKPNLERFNLY